MTVRIGLTGPIGCGKSTIAGWLAERGASVVDADLVARRVLERDEPAIGEVAERFGPAVQLPDGEIDRAALGRIVFADPGALRDLEAIVHPRVRPRILGAIADAEATGRQAIVIEAIKLVEGGLAELCDAVWLVTCDEDVQRERLAARGMPPDDATQRMSAQRELAARLRAAATVELETSGHFDATRSRVLAAYDAALAAPRARATPG